MKNTVLIAACLVIPTVGRRARLMQTLRSVLAQDVLPSQIVVVDGSAVAWRWAELAGELGHLLPESVELVVEAANCRGAGVQRNQAVDRSCHPFVWFLDDDVDLEPGCFNALWQAMEEDHRLGGCNAVITNQRYSPPGRAMRRLLSWLGCPPAGSLAGLCRGPALNFLPTDDASDGNERAEWLNTTCTLYRREALPDPPFLSFFHGYSLMEDLALSLEVGKRWNLRSVPGSRIYHDTGQADYKSRVATRQAMEVANRWFVSCRVMGCPPLELLYRLLLLQGIGLLAQLSTPRRWTSLPGWCFGTYSGLWRIVRHGRSWKAYTQEPCPKP